MLHINPGAILAVGMCAGIVSALIAGAVAIYIVRREPRHTTTDLTASELLDHPTQPLYNNPQYGDQLNTDASPDPGHEAAG